MADDITQIIEAAKGLSPGGVVVVVLSFIGYAETRWRRLWVSHLERARVAAVRIELLAEKNGITDNDVAVRLARPRVVAATPLVDPPAEAAA